MRKISLFAVCPECGAALVRRHAGHVTERPRLGFPFARSAAAEVNYSCVQIRPAILRRHPITGAVQRGNSVTHSVADATRNWCLGLLNLSESRYYGFFGKSDNGSGLSLCFDTAAATAS
jgi:hypothetical protein